MFDAKPEDRESFAVYILDIEIDHKAGPDGNLIPYERLTLGKKGAPNYQHIVNVNRLEKDNPALFAHLLPTIEGWRKTQTITTEGHALEAWPLITKGQLKQMKNLGLRSVEDVAQATDAVREKYGMGFLDLQKQARAFLANKAGNAAASRLQAQDDMIAQLKADLDEARKTIDGLAAQMGKTPQKPKPRKMEVAA